MHKMLLEIPERIEAQRIYLRRYRAGDGQWYYAVSQRNRDHLSRYEAGNVIMSIQSAQEAEDEANVRSRRVAERCGMILEGHIRENKRNAGGTLSGTLHFGLLKSEFEALDKHP